MGSKDGLGHVSEIRNERVEKVSDVLSEGQEVKVKVLEIDNRGKVRLSMRVVDQETGEELEDTRPAREPREPRGDRGRSEEHTSELQSLMRISYAVFCLKKKKKTNKRIMNTNTHIHTQQSDKDHAENKSHKHV